MGKIEPHKLYSKAENIMEIHDDGKNGLIFEVDLEYPINLHNAHNDYPFCCEKQTLPRFQISSKRILKSILSVLSNENKKCCQSECVQSVIQL